MRTMGLNDQARHLKMRVNRAFQNMDISAFGYLCVGYVPMSTSSSSACWLPRRVDAASCIRSAYS